MDEIDELTQLEELLNADLGENEAKGSVSEVNIFSVESNLLSNNVEKAANDTSAIHNGDTDSSDDEERRNYTERKYNDYGSQVKKALDHTEQEKLDKKIEFETRLRQTNIDVKVEQNSTFKKKSCVVSDTTDKNTFCAPTTKLPKSDVYSDPVFGIRITKPLISSSSLLDRMQGREAVNMLRLKRYVENEDLSKDWVVAGVIVRKNISKNQKGNQFAIWTLSDLMHDLKTASMFLFRKAYNDLWKTSEGMVVAVLNPNVLDRSQNKDEACLSVENPDRVMVLGQSKDLGVCKSRKKNGEPCKAFINLSQGEHCIYHVKLDYQKYSKRQELQSSTMGKGLVNLQNKVLGKSSVIYGGKVYSALPSGNNKKVKERDQNRLMSLSDYHKSENDDLMRNKAPLGAGPMSKKCDILHSPTVQRSSDKDRLNKLNSSPQTSNTSQYSSLAEKVASSPKLGKGFSLKGSGTIDLNVSYGQRAAEKAKATALRLVQQNGGIEKVDPNNIKGTAAGKKRALEKLQTDCNDENDNKKAKLNGGEGKSVKPVMSERFKKIMEATSAHQNLIQQHDDNEQDKYFDKLEKKEAMEERMLNTFKLACKAVRCIKCKYTALSAAQKCKDERHPLKVLDTFKRFFKCSNCSNRTISLDVIPLHACSNCGGSNWQKAPMLREKKVTSLTQGLSIRGEEETFVGGQINVGKNIDLLVPDEE